jgi:hypothetical protein
MTCPMSAVLIGEPSVRFPPAAARGSNQAAREAGDPPSLTVGEAVDSDLDVQGNVVTLNALSVLMICPRLSISIVCPGHR